LAGASPDLIGSKAAVIEYGSVRNFSEMLLALAT
jgi:hypothetical protein